MHDLNNSTNTLKHCAQNLVEYAAKISKLEEAKKKLDSVSRIDVHFKGEGGGSITVDTQPSTEILSVLLTSEIYRLLESCQRTAIAAGEACNNISRIAKEILQPSAADSPHRKIRHE